MKMTLSFGFENAYVKVMTLYTSSNRTDMSFNFVSTILLHGMFHEASFANVTLRTMLEKTFSPRENRVNHEVYQKWM